MRLLNRFEAIRRIQGMKKKEMEELLLETYIHGINGRTNALHCIMQVDKHIMEIRKYLNLLEMFIEGKNYKMRFPMKKDFEDLLKHINEIDRNQTESRDAESLEIAIIE